MSLELTRACHLSMNLPLFDRRAPFGAMVRHRGDASAATKKFRTGAGFAGFHAEQRESCCALPRVPCAISILCIRP